MQAVAQSVWLFLSDPNVAFLLLVTGIWSVVFAVSVPGTGVPEAAAVVSLALAAVGLFQLPVNLAGLALLALAMLLFIVEFQVKAHGALLLGGVIAMALGALFLFRVEDRSAATLTWPTIIGAPLITAVFFGFILRQGLAAQRAPALQDLRRLIGTRGVTRTPIGRDGTVYVGGEEWSATSETPIPPAADVVVLERKGLTLKVAPVPRTTGAAGAAQPGSETAIRS